MIQGTASGVGKSLLTAALCRLTARRGIAVAPFKAQNMSNNAAVTVDGGEIGRAQWLQAVAAGLEPEIVMNPVLLKPMTDTRSEVVRVGRHDAEASALPWRERKAILWPTVRDALGDLRGRFDLVVAEGAGSPAETNLRDSDIVNMEVARHAGAAVLLVADIDRGGAFASLFGTWHLMEEEDRRLFRGFILNRFRGDASLLAPAPKQLEERTGVPVLGVVPWIQHLLPEEDGGPRLEPTDRACASGSAVIGVVRFPRASNLDDLDPLRRESDVTLRAVRRPRDLANLTALILPGSRNTMDDLRWMRSTGLADAIQGWAVDGLPVVGLCGGYQMMGRRISDPRRIEGGGYEPGLGLLELETELAWTKEIRQTRALVVGEAEAFDRSMVGSEVSGYEIHHGRTRAGAGASLWLSEEDRALGHTQGRNWGCYLHGILANDALRTSWLGGLGVTGEPTVWAGEVDRELDRVADAVEANLDVDRILDLVALGGNTPV